MNRMENPPPQRGDRTGDDEFVIGGLPPCRGPDAHMNASDIAVALRRVGRRRLVGYGVVALLILASLFPGPLQGLATVVWAVGNAAFWMAAAAWGLASMRWVLLGQSVAQRWALWLAAL